MPPLRYIGFVAPPTVAVPNLDAVLALPLSFPVNEFAFTSPFTSNLYSGVILSAIYLLIVTQFFLTCIVGVTLL